MRKLANEISPSAFGGPAVYLSVWVSSVCDVLTKITGIAFTAVDLAPPAVAELAEVLREQGVWLRFAVEKTLKGEQAFGIGKSDALRLAQVLMGEPCDETQEFSPDHQDALAELFRQFAGTAALALKPRAGGEVSLQFSGYEPASWKPHTQWGGRLEGAGAGPFQLIIFLNPQLGESLTSGSTAKAAEPSSASTRWPPVASASPPKGKNNIDLLLDVELPVALRFGKREMPLGDILELTVGGVVELDQKILDPVELILGGKVVAQGEVVVMDGHYALRVTEVLNPVERIESLR